MTIHTSTSQRHAARSPFAAPVEQPIEQFELGDRVTHFQHGLGRVVMQQNAGVAVDFGVHRTWIASPFAGLSKL